MSNTVLDTPTGPPAAIVNPLDDLRRKREEAAADLAQAQADLAAAGDLPARVPTPMGPKLSDLVRGGATLGDLIEAIENLRRERAAATVAASPQVAAEADARRRIGKATAYLRETADPSLSDEIKELKRRIGKLEESRMHLGRCVAQADEVDNLAQRLATWEVGAIGSDDLRFFLQRSHRPLALLDDLYPSKQLASLPVGATNLRKKVEQRAAELSLSLRRDALAWLRTEVAGRQARLVDVTAARARLAAVEGRILAGQEEIRRLRERQLEP